MSVTIAVLVGCSGAHPADTETVRSRPNQTAAEFNVQLGVGYLEQGNISRSKEKLLLALKQAPDWPPALDAMAYFLESTGQPNEAKKYYLKALALNQSGGSSANNYGTFLCRQKDYRGALAYFEKAVADPNYLNTAEAYENAGMCAAMIPDQVTADRYFKLAYDRNPMRPLPLLKLAGFYYRQNDYKQANVLLDRYNTIEKPNAESLALGVKVAQALGDTNTAASDMLLLKEKFPQA